MAQPDCILLHFGESHGVTVARRATFWVALSAILLAPADPIWRLGLVLLLSGLYRITGKGSPAGQLRMYRDGDAKVFEQGKPSEYRRDTGGWVSRWFSVVPLVDVAGRERRRVIVCAASNSEEEYRRLLGWLRMLQPGGSTLR